PCNSMMWVEIFQAADYPVIRGPKQGKMLVVLPPKSVPTSRTFRCLRMAYTAVVKPSGLPPTMQA
ncbi:MAG TPA: hypothetical protein VLM78_06745, partial [Anaerolineales bacterium]|nr:hypothetical protein [Anaerolineales bacterium]